MMTTVNARFANGMLTPLEPLNLPEGALVALYIAAGAVSKPEAEADPPRAAAVPDHSGFMPGIDPNKLNQLNDELMFQEYLEKQCRDRERYR